LELELMNYVTSLDLGLFHLTNADFGVSSAKLRKES
jgi:hypothetical protein